MYNHVKSICIVGGGTSGWMTAAAIAKKIPNIKLTLVESPVIPIIGVGESTLGHINQYMHLLGINDEDWMPHCNATYKTSIKFIDFRENPKEEPHTFHYPFGIFDVTEKPRNVMDWFLARAEDSSIDPKNFAEFHHDAILMTDENKMTRNEDHRIRGFNFVHDTAYHMDAALFGNWLRDNICLPSGMAHVINTVDQIVQRDDDSIEKITTKEGNEFYADLFIDCTGFKSLLLEETLKEPFISFHDTLLNDSAVATVIPYIDKEREMENYTSCTAIEAGWVWNIPLWHRIGTGYVYSSKHATKEEAEAQLRKHLKSNRMMFPDAKRADECEVRHIKIKHGVHERAWVKNVVGIGLANGFIEPLESTGLMLTHEGIIKLVAALTMRNGVVSNYDVSLFNSGFQDQILGMKDFISQHYALTMRHDTPYWKEVSGKIAYSSSVSKLAELSGLANPRSSSTDLAERLHRTRVFDPDMGGIIYIAAGMGYNPVDRANKRFLDSKYLETPGYEKEVYNNWLEHKNEVLEYIKTLPTHYQFLKDNIHKS
jgi:flavin-dependent dehydrogenase